MYPKASLIALCAAATVKEAVAAHGHQHVHAGKREIVWAATETVVVTDYFTVTATVRPGQTGVGASNPIKDRPEHLSSSSVATTTSSTSTIIVKSSTSTSTPTVKPTTLATQVKPSTSKVSTTVTTSAKTTVSTSAQTTVSTSEAKTTASTSAETTTSAPVEAPTAVSVASTSAAPKTSKSGKRGLAYNDASLVTEYIKLGGVASWAYNWAPSGSGLPAGVTYYPMLWSPAPDHSNGWDGFAKAAVANGADSLLGFNEPDVASQSNMSPQDAASAHIKWMNPYQNIARISAPAISSSENAGQGIDWLKQFFAACNGQCHFDFCVAHWYGPGGASGASQFLQHLQDVHTACGGNKPVWVTEFAAQSGNVDDFMSAVVKALETNSTYSFVEKYSYFMASVGELFTTTTQLSSYGKIYAGLS